MLPLLLTLLTNDAEACNPGLPLFINALPALVDDVDPDAGDVAPPVLPSDSIFYVELGDGYYYSSEVTVRLLENGTLVDHELDVHTRTIDLIKEHIILEVRPIGEPNIGSIYSVELETQLEDRTVSVFEVGAGSTANISAVPSFSVSHDFEITPFENSCGNYSETDLLFSFDGHPEGQTINLYRINAELYQSGDAVPSNHQGNRFHTILYPNQNRSLPALITDAEESEGHCFYARFGNQAGLQGEASPVVCSIDTSSSTGADDDDNAKGALGCASAGSKDRPFWAILLVVLGLIRPRR